MLLAISINTGKTHDAEGAVCLVLAAHTKLQAFALRVNFNIWTAAAAQLEKSVCIGAMFWSKAEYWESPVLASFSCLAAWDSWKAASGWAESGSRVHSLSSRSPTPFRSSRKPKAKAAFRRRFSSWRVDSQNI